MSQQIPDRNNPLELFEYSVRRVIQLDLMGETRTHRSGLTISSRQKRTQRFAKTS